MTQWLILACFISIAFSDWKRRIIPNSLLIVIAVLSLVGRTTIEILTNIGIGLAACIVGFVLYRLGQWAKGDVKLTGVVGLAFGTQTPYVVLIAALVMIAYQIIRKSKEGLPWGVPVAVGVVILLLTKQLST